MTPSRHNAKGVALLAVLWTVAALSVLVGSLVQTQRASIAMVAQSRQLVEGRAVGQSAIGLVAARIVAGKIDVLQTQTFTVQVAQQTIPVEVMALGGLIDAGKAPAALLEQTLKIAAGVQPQRATVLAKEWVAARGDAGGRGGWLAVEELLALPSMDYDLFYNLAPLLTLQSDTGGGLVDPLFAPVSVVRVLCNGDQAILAQFMAARSSGQPGTDTTRLEARFLGKSGRTRFRLVARVAVGPDEEVRVTSDLRLRPAEGLPWQVLGTTESINRPRPSKPTP